MPLPLRRKSRRERPCRLGGSFADLGQPVFILLLLGRLGRRDELFVGGDPRRDRRQEVGLGVEVALTDPHGSHSWSGWERGRVQGSAARLGLPLTISGNR